MFLMEGYFGTYLHTGDFRFDPLILQNDVLKNKIIDCLFLDDTFCDPEYVFPPRNEAGKQVLDIIKQYPSNYQILLAVDTLGKEELMVAIALTFKTLIVVDEERLRQLNIIRQFVDLPDVFTHDKKLGRVYAVPKKGLNYKRIMRERLSRPTIGILPSGWSVHKVTKTNEKLPLYVSNYFFFLIF